MSNGDADPQGGQNSLMKSEGNEKARKTREAYKAKASSDLYGGIGWMAGLLITLFASTPVLWYLSNNASRSIREQVLAMGFAVAWWLNPISLGGLGYIISNIRSWRWWTVLAMIVWIGVNLMVSFSIASETARAQVVNGLLILFYVLMGLLFLYVQLRVFLWAAAGKPGRFFFGLLGWATLNGIVYWAVISPEV